MVNSQAVGASSGRSSKQSLSPSRWNRGFSVAVVGLFLFTLLLPAGALVSTHAPVTAIEVVTPPAAAPAASPAFPTPIHHVILIVDENEGLGAVMNNAPYYRQLATAYATAGNFWAVAPNSEPAYLAMTSGIDPDQFIGGGYHVLNLADLTKAAGQSWGAYLEGMPVPSCDGGGNDDATGYESAHNPFVQYADVFDNKQVCANDTTLQAWNTTATGYSSTDDTIPNFALIVPSEFNDMSNKTFTTGNAWLQNFLPTILNAPWFSSTAVFITFDESSWPYIDFNGTTGGHIPLIAVSPYAHMGYNSSHAYTQFSVLTTIEWLLGLGSTGHNDNWTLQPPMRDLFTLPTTHSITNYGVTGTVISNASSPVNLSGAEVSVEGSGQGASTSTNGSGGFAFNLPNGSYTFTATRPGYMTGSTFDTVSGANQSGLMIRLTPIPHTYFYVSGKVVGPTGPLVGATVEYSNASSSARPQGVITAANGTFSVLVGEGNYNFTASEAGFVPVPHNVPVTANVTGLVFDLVLFTFEVAGTVTSASSGAPVNLSQVYLNATDGTSIITATTNGSGMFLVSLANGTYTLVVTASGYDRYSTTISVQGAPVSLAIQLASSSSGSGTSGLESELTQPWVIGLIVAVIIGVAAAAYILSRRRAPPAAAATPPTPPETPPAP